MSGECGDSDVQQESNGHVCWEVRLKTWTGRFSIGVSIGSALIQNEHLNNTMVDTYMDFLEMDF